MRRPCRLLFCRSVSRAFNEINEVRQQISHRQVVRRGRNLVRALLYITAEIGELWPRWSSWAPRYWRVQRNCNVFLVHRLTERYKIWQRYGSGQLTLIARIWWTLIRDTIRRHASVLRWCTCFMFGLLMKACFCYAALRSRCGHYIFVLFLFSFFLFSSPNLSRQRMDVYHTSTHGVALVRI